jgi:hypothetical protein
MPSWLKRFPSLTNRIDKVGIWWAVFGPGGVLSVIMGWAASAFTPIAELGRGAIIFAGVGAACVIMFAASALLVAWRYFNPLPQALIKTEAVTDGQGASAQTNSINPLITALGNKIDELSRQLQKLESRTQQTEVKYQILNGALHARDAEAIIKEADQKIISTATRLLEGNYPDEAAWAADYGVWKKAMSQVDGVLSRWLQHHEAFLDVRLTDLEAGGPRPPPQSKIESDTNIMRYKTVWMVQQNYANQRDNMLIYFSTKTGLLSA